MKIYVFVDMEGISGISGSSFVNDDGADYQIGRKYFTLDINACVRGCFAAGAEAVIVRDGHASGNNAIWELVDSRAELIQGANPPDNRYGPGLEDCDALILLGYHAFAGTPGALLEHTYSSKSIQNLWLNGKLVGETGIDAAIAAEYGVPTIMASGDDKLCREAQGWVPGVVTCQVKLGLSCQGARLLSLETAHKLIEDKTTEAVGKLGSIPLLELERPVTLRKEVVERGQLKTGPGITVIDGRTTEITAAKLEDALFRLM